MKKIIAANWKMHKTPKESIAFIKKIKPKIKAKKKKIILFPPFTSLAPISNIIKKSQSLPSTSSSLKISLGAQNIFYEKQGAYTGEISPLMLKGLNISYVIIGHSERRKYFNETDEIISKKMQACIKNNLTPILCIGENKLQRMFFMTKQTLRSQLKKGLSKIRKSQFKNIVIAYEPLWAVGTGKPDSAEDTEKVHEFIRAVLSNLITPKIAESIPILYGGSINARNAKSFLKKKNINGLLIGHESLIPSHFLRIINS